MSLFQVQSLIIFLPYLMIYWSFAGMIWESPNEWIQNSAFAQWKSLRVSEFQSQTNLNTQMLSANCRLWCCWQLSRLRYDNESNELSRWYPLISIWYYRIPLCTSVWYDFNAWCHRELSIPRINWITTEAGVKLHFSSRTRYWTHCIGRTRVFSCSWKTWRWQKE